MCTPQSRGSQWDEIEAVACHTRTLTSGSGHQVVQTVASPGQATGSALRL